MGVSHLLVSSLNSVKYCALSVGEKGKFSHMWEHPTYPVAICPHSSSPPLDPLSLSLQYLLRIPNQAPSFVTAPLLSLFS